MLHARRHVRNLGGKGVTIPLYLVRDGPSIDYVLGSFPHILRNVSYAVRAEKIRMVDLNVGPE